MVFFPEEVRTLTLIQLWKNYTLIQFLRRTDGRQTDGQTMVNSIVPLFHFVRRVTKNIQGHIFAICLSFSIRTLPTEEASCNQYHDCNFLYMNLKGILCKAHIRFHIPFISLHVHLKDTPWCTRKYYLKYCRTHLLTCGLGAESVNTVEIIQCSPATIFPVSVAYTQNKYIWAHLILTQ